MFRGAAPPPIPFQATLSPRHFPCVCLLGRTDENVTHTHIIPPREETKHCPNRGENWEANTSFSDTTLYTQHWKGSPKQYTYLVKIGKTVRVLTQTLVLSPESVTSRYFPKLLQVNDIQCTGQRRPICYNHGLRQECASTEQWDRSLGKRSGFSLKGKLRPESGPWGQYMLLQRWLRKWLQNPHSATTSTVCHCSYLIAF